MELMFNYTPFSNPDTYRININKESYEPFFKMFIGQERFHNDGSPKEFVKIDFSLQRKDYDKITKYTFKSGDKYFQSTRHNILYKDIWYDMCRASKIYKKTVHRGMHKDYRDVVHIILYGLKAKDNVPFDWIQTFLSKDLSIKHDKQEYPDDPVLSIDDLPADVYKGLCDIHSEKWLRSLSDKELTELIK